MCAAQSFLSIHSSDYSDLPEVAQFEMLVLASNLMEPELSEQK